jgi:hypothetical protein
MTAKAAALQVPNPVAIISSALVLVVVLLSEALRTLL